MDQHIYEAAKASYQQGNWANAATLLTEAKRSNELDGPSGHLLGNALMKLGMYKDAADAYGDALKDPSYGKVGALACNRSRAFLALGKYQEAAKSAEFALDDPSYQTPFKAFMALGEAQFNLHHYQEAGSAFRNAAMDETNANPAKALVELGSCFMYMGRPADAVESYRTALDFSGPLASQNSIYADLGRAYVASNRMPEAVDAFNQATADGTYVLDTDAQASFEAAKRAISAAQDKPSETDQFLAQAGYANNYMNNVDPLDPLGKSGEMMPSPDDTGFFSISEEDLIAQDVPESAKIKPRKKKHPVLKFFLVWFILLLLAGAAGGTAFYLGYGWPTQTAVVQGLFNAKSTHQDMNSYFASSVDPQMKTTYENALPNNALVEIKGIDKSMMSSKVLAVAKLPQGGEQSYTIELTRDKIGWKVVSVQTDYKSQDGANPSLSNATNGATNSQANNNTSNVNSSSTGVQSGQTNQNGSANAQNNGSSNSSDTSGSTNGSGSTSGDSSSSNNANGSTNTSSSQSGSSSSSDTNGNH